MNIIPPDHVYKRIQKAGESIGVGFDEAVTLIAAFGIWPSDVLERPDEYPEFADLRAYLENKEQGK